MKSCGSYGKEYKATKISLNKIQNKLNDSGSSENDQSISKLFIHEISLAEY